MSNLDEIRVLADALPVIVYVADVSGSNTFTNQPFQNFCGMTAETLLGDGWLRALHPEDQQRAQAAWARAVGSGQPYEVEFRLRHHGGEYHWHLCRGVPVRNADGDIDHWVGTCTNVHDHKRDQLALRESERREGRQRQFLETLLDNADVCIAVLAGEELRYTLVNTAYQQLHPELPMIGLTLREVFPSAVAAENMARRVMRTGRWERDFAYPVPVPGRPDACWDYRISTMPTGPGEPPAVLVTAWDATERARAQAALVESEERWKLALAVTRAGAWELDLRDGAAWRSLRHDQIFGYEQLLPSWSYEQFLDHVVAEDRPAVAQAFEESQRNRSDWGFECRINRADGAIRWIRAIGRPSYDVAGQPVKMRGVVEDISERKEAEEALRRSENTLNAILDTLPVAVVIADAEGRIIRDNQANRELWGMPPETLSWQQYGDWVAWWPDTGERIKADEWAMARALLHGEETRDELILNQRFGSDQRRYYLNNVAPLRDAGGRIVGGVAAQLDVTERIAAEEAVRDSDRAKDEFLAVLGHELRNPLAPLRTGLDLLAQAPRDAALLDSLLPMMDRQLSHLVRLVDDLLDISRVNRGLLELQPAPLDLAAPLAAAVEQVKPLVEERRHDLIVEPAPGPLQVNGDFERLTQVFANLLSNAAKYTEPGGRIRVISALEHGQAVVRVRDTGFGIPPQHMDHLFTLFSQIPEHRDGTGAGLGIGLALSRQLIEMHAGTIEAHSDGLGQGSEFVVRLPVSRRETAARPSPSPTTDAPSRRVLIVDDNIDAADGLGMLLEVKGHAVEIAYDGPSALDAMRRLMPEVVLLDLGLPGMDGLEVARRARALPGGDDMLLVAVTGWGQDEDKARTRDAGFDAHLTKPLDSDRITTVLADFRHAGPR